MNSAITKLIPAYLLAIALLVLPLSAQTWQSYTDINHIYSVLATPEYIYLGALGGIIQWDGENAMSIYNNLSGLAGLKVSSLAKSSDGKIWYSTSEGGIGYISSSTLPSSTQFMENGFGINQIVVDEAVLWVATNKGVSLFNPIGGNQIGEIKETYLKLGDFPYETNCRDILLLNDSVYVATDKGIAKAPRDYLAHNLLDPSSWQNITTEFIIYGLFYLYDKIYAGTEDGLYSIIGDSLTEEALSTYSLNEGIVYNDTFFVYGGSGVFKQGTTSWSRVNVRDLPYQSSNGLAVLNGELYSFHSRGYTRYRNGELKGYRFNCPIGDYFQDFAVDGSGKVWSCGRNNSLSFYDGFRWTSLTSLPFNFSSFPYLYQFPTTRVYTLKADHQGRIWCGSWGDGAFVITNPDSFYTITDTTSPLEPAAGEHYVIVSDIERDAQGNMWLANYGAPATALVVYPKADIESTEPTVYSISSTGITNSEIYCLELRGNYVYIGFKESGLLRIDHKGSIDNPDDDSYRYFTTSDGLPTNTINVLEVDSAGNLFIGTDGGLAKLPAGFDIIEEEILPSDFPLQITALLIDSWGNLWVGTPGGVAYKSSEGTEFQVIRSFYSTYAEYEQKQGLLSDMVYSIFEDVNTGAIWFGTEGGISRLAVGGGEMSKLSVDIYPNPFYVEYGEGNLVRISGVPSDAIVRIITVDGKVVREFPGGSAGYSGIITWDGTNREGNFVSAGIYFCQVVSRKLGGQVIKFALIR